MVKIKAPSDPKELPRAAVQQMTILATSGLGLVAALAWNNVIKEVVDQYIKPLIGQESGIASLFIYATLVTVLAVLVTLQLTRIEQRLSGNGQKK